MFRELVYSSGIMSIITCGTEIIYRVKEKEITDHNYQLQSTYLISATCAQLIVSYLIFRNISRIKIHILKVLAVLFTSVLIVAIILRSKYNFFLPLESQNTLYNITSFFLCLQTVTFGMLSFYSDVDPENDSENGNDTVSLEQTNHRRQRRRRNRSTASVHAYDGEIDYTLPSYSEVPAPPAYTKNAIVIPPESNGEANDTIAISIPEASSNNTRDAVHMSVPDTMSNEEDIVERPVIERNTQ